MAIVLDHTIVPAHDKEASARFLARILGLRYEGPLSHFAPLRVNDTLTLDFDNDTNFESHHYAFKVDEAAFEGIFDRVRLDVALGYGRGGRRLAACDDRFGDRRGGLQRVRRRCRRGCCTALPRAGSPMRCGRRRRSPWARGSSAIAATARTS